MYFNRLLSLLASRPISNSTKRIRLKTIEAHRLAECLVLALAMGSCFALWWGTFKRIPLLFLPWMLVYGFELLAGWTVTLAFILLPGKIKRFCNLSGGKKQKN